MDCSNAQVATCFPRPASVARLFVQPAQEFGIQLSGKGTVESLRAVWLPQKFKPRKTGAGPTRLFGTSTSSCIFGRPDECKISVISFWVALPPRAFLSVRPI